MTEVNEYTMLSIPTELLEAVGIEDGDTIQMNAAEGRIVIEPVLDDDSDDGDCDGYCEFCPFAEECEEGEDD